MEIKQQSNMSSNFGVIKKETPFQKNSWYLRKYFYLRSPFLKITLERNAYNTTISS